MKDFKDLVVWQKSHILTLRVYSLTGQFPKEEVYSLTSQLRRAASSIPANIAEGCGRGGDKELARYFQIAMGSASETQYHLLLARDLGYLSKEEWSKSENQVTEVKKMLASFIVKLRS